MDRLALIALLGGQCVDCGTTGNLQVHHQNLDYANNDLANLQILCRKHHRDWHSGYPELRILRAIEKGPSTFTEMLIQSKVNRQTLADYRRQLLKDGLIDRDDIKRTYALTAKGASKIT